MDYYAVIGNPINHSKSPLIHHLFAQQTKQNLTYTAVLVALDNLSAALTSLQSQGFKGLNITQPFKQQAVSLVDNLSPRASRAKAINTLVFREDGSRFGDNTDGIGFVRDIQVNRRVTLQGKRILILGAGGAARGIIEAICNEKPETLVVANRSVSKVIALANDFPSICPSSLANLGNDSFDIIINSTSASSSEIVSMLPVTLLSPSTYCYDLVYGQEMTPFIQWAKNQGAVLYSDGLGMLIEQAAESFYIWRSIRPQVQLVWACLSRSS